MERDYNSYLRSFVKEVFRQTRDTFTPRRLRELKENAEQVRRLDDYVEDIGGFVQSIRITVESGRFSATSISNKVEEFAGSASNFNKRQWQKILRAGLGVDLTQNEPWLATEINRFTRENVRLITKLSEEMYVDIERNILDAARQGLSNREISGIISGREGVYGSRADLIARDQMNKYNGRLMENRQRQTGVERYVWRSSDDRRVRPLHQEYDDRTFSWDSPPADGHPGTPIQCRCYAEPIFDEVYDKLERATNPGGQV
jgi:SPP1 gp7 family putative phage head morphogenesis protein